MIWDLSEWLRLVMVYASTLEFVRQVLHFFNTLWSRLWFYVITPAHVNLFLSKFSLIIWCTSISQKVKIMNYPMGEDRKFASRPHVESRRNRDNSTMNCVAVRVWCRFTYLVVCPTLQTTKFVSTPQHQLCAGWPLHYNLHFSLLFSTIL